jgi:type I restriction-modification system DNA methylase subunit
MHKAGENIQQAVAGEGLLLAIPGSSSMADALHINVVLARGNKRRLILLADGFLFRTAKNDQIYKRSLVERHELTSVISLPRGIIGRDSSVLSSLLVFDAPETSAEKVVRFVDCRSDWPSKSRLQSPQAAEHQLGACLARIPDWANAIASLGRRHDRSIHPNGRSAPLGYSCTPCR